MPSMIRLVSFLTHTRVFNFREIANILLFSAIFLALTIYSRLAKSWVKWVLLVFILYSSLSIPNLITLSMATRPIYVLAYLIEVVLMIVSFLLLLLAKTKG